MKRQSDILRNNYLNTVAVDPDLIGNPNIGETFNGVFNNNSWIKDSDGNVTVGIIPPEAYQWFSDTDPESIGTPPASNYYQGVFNGKRWTKDSAGLIVYSASGLWKIFDNSQDDIIIEEDWLGNLVRWVNAANGTLRLDNSVLNYPEGWHFSIYNNTAVHSISIVAEGTDTLRSHNNIFVIPAYSYAQIGLIFVNGVTEWYASIEQTFKPALGQIAKGAIGLNVPVTANVWELVPYATYATGELVNVTPTANGGLQITYPNNGTNGVYVDIDIMASISVPNATQTVDLSFGIDGTVFSGADILRQSATSGASQTSDMFWPYYFHFSGLFPNGSVINPFIRSEETSTIPIIALTLTVQARSYTGVDISI